MRPQRLLLGFSFRLSSRKGGAVTGITGHGEGHHTAPSAWPRIRTPSVKAFNIEQPWHREPLTRRAIRKNHLRAPSFAAFPNVPYVFMMSFIAKGTSRLKS